MSLAKASGKKTAHACLPCQKAHIHCTKERPCDPCINRNQPEGCVDGLRKVCKYLLDDIHQPEAVDGCISLPPASHAAPADTHHEVPGQAYILKSEYDHLQTLVDIPNFNGNSETATSPSFVDWRLSRQDLNPSLASIYTSSDIVPFNYDLSNNALVRWARAALSDSEMRLLLTKLGPYQFSLLDTLRNLSVDDLLHSERTLARCMAESNLLVGLTGTPAAIWRRTGEILVANTEFCQMMRRSADELQGLRIYEIMSPDSALKYWTEYLMVATDASAPQSFSIRVELGSALFVLWATIRRDSFDLPLYVLGHCLPVFKF